MTTEQLRSLAAAIDAHLRGEKVEVCHKGSDNWLVSADPVFNAADCQYRPAPKEPLKRWVVLSENGLFDNSSVDKAGAESIAKRLKGSVIELTETSRQSFKREPMRFWGWIQNECQIQIRRTKISAENDANLSGGRVAEFVEVV